MYYQLKFLFSEMFKGVVLFQVEKLARESFFFLTESFPFDEASFGELLDTVTVNKPMLMPRSVSYVFDMHPPSDIQFGDYASVFQKHLHDRKMA